MYGIRAGRVIVQTMYSRGLPICLVLGDVLVDDGSVLMLFFSHDIAACSARQWRHSAFVGIWWWVSFFRQWQSGDAWCLLLFLGEYGGVVCCFHCSVSSYFLLHCLVVIMLMLHSSDVVLGIANLLCWSPLCCCILMEIVTLRWLSSLVLLWKLIIYTESNIMCIVINPINKSIFLHLCLRKYISLNLYACIIYIINRNVRNAEITMK